MRDIATIIKQLDLIAHPEGGFYQRVFTSPIPAVFGDDAVARVACTTIIYLLDARNFSAFHRIQSDELWLLGEGNTSFNIIELRDGSWVETVLSREHPLHCVKANTWFAAELVDNSDDAFALAYCTVVPGFQFDEFEMAEAAVLNREFPQYAEGIRRLCRM